MYIHIHTYIHTYVRTYTHICMHACAQIHTCTHAYIFTFYTLKGVKILKNYGKRSNLHTYPDSHIHTYILYIERSENFEELRQKIEPTYIPRLTHTYINNLHITVTKLLIITPK